MTKYPIEIQDSESSCGVYCIKMILRYFHQDDEIARLKKKCRLTPQGVSVYGLIQCLKSYGIESNAYQCDFKDLLHDMNDIAILHLKIDQLYHYVVLYKVTDHYFLIGDPAQGLIKMPYEQLHECFTGILVRIHHVGRPLHHHQVISFSSFIKKHFQHYYHTIISIVFKTLIMTVLSVALSFYYQLVIDRFHHYSIILIIIISTAFLLVYIIKNSLLYFRNQTTIQLNKNLNQNYVMKTLQNMVHLDLESFYLKQEGQFLTQVNHLQKMSDYFISLYRVLFIDGLMIVIFTGVLVFMNIVLGIYVCLMMIFIMAYIYFQTKTLNQWHKDILSHQEIVQQGLIEYYHNFFHTLQFLNKPFIKRKISYLYQYYYDKDYNKQFFINRFHVLLDIFIQGLLMTSIVFSLCLYKESKMTLGSVMMIYMLISYMIEPMMNISTFLIIHHEIIVIFDQYKEMIPPKYQRKRKLKKIQSIDIDNMTFSYGYSRPLFKHYSLHIDHSLLIQGPTGSGKSTLLKIISGQLEWISGEVYINHHPMRDYDRHQFYRLVKYLDKKPVFYQETIAYNCLLDKYDQAEMVSLFHYFQLDDLLKNQNQVIDVDGGFLSSGQQQLIMIIRSLLSHPQVLILDEAFSHVDKKRVELIYRYLNQHRIISLIVDHRINDVNNNYDCVIIEAKK